MNDLLMLGVNHHSTPLEIREHLAWKADHLPSVLAELNDLILSTAESPCHCKPVNHSPEIVILSTCNRCEIYLAVSDVCQARHTVMAHLALKTGVDVSMLESQVYSVCGQDVVQHLFTVSAGLDSLVKGEHEILGQVKDAFSIAQQRNTCGTILSTLFRHAIQVGKRIRTETEIGRLRHSIATVVVELAQDTFGCLEAHTALLIGAGKFSTITARALIASGLHCVLVANRTFDRALSLANSLGASKAEAVHFDALPASLSTADIVISSTGAPHIVLHADQVTQALKKRPLRPLLVIDLAVPRDVDPAIGSLPDVSLVHLDQLEGLAHERYPLSAAVHQAVELIIAEGVNDFWVWYETRRSAPVIRALCQKAQLICAEELSRTFRRMDGLTPSQQQAVEVMAQAIVKKLLHDPINALKQAGSDQDDEMLVLIEDLYNLHPHEML